VTFDERVDRVRELGYTEREARFLALAAVHSGYFLRRQFTQSTGAGSGKTAAVFTSKLLRFEHATVVAVCHNAHLFHLYAKPLYERLGIPESRNRRSRAPFAVKAKLMGLDYVLAHADCAFFATYVERLAFFTQVLGVDRDALPRSSTARAAIADRAIFVDGFPLGLSTSVTATPSSCSAMSTTAGRRSAPFRRTLPIPLALLQPHRTSATRLHWALPPAFSRRARRVRSFHRRTRKYAAGRRDQILLGSPRLTACSSMK